MEKSLTIAKSILSDMFDVSTIHFSEKISRKFKYNEARRFLVYYLVKECGVKYANVSLYIPALTNHATAIHHCRKMDDMLSIEPRTQRLWLKFTEKMETEGQTHLIKDYESASTELLSLKLKVRNLKKML
jgi:hypothetical protein